jgi:hypothetical protein
VRDEKARRERIRENVAAYRKLQKALLNNTDGTIPVSDEKNPLVSMENENGVSSTSSAQLLVVKMPTTVSFLCFQLLLCLVSDRIFS